MSERTRYPLTWPSGWKRTKVGDRRRAKFQTVKSRQVQGGTPGTYYTRQDREKVSLGEATGRLAGELRRLGVLEGDWLLSSNVRTRLDGLPYADAANPADPGAAVYFRLRKEDRVLACDTWDRLADNVAAIAAHIEAIRAIDRYGVGTLEQAFAGYQALPAKGDTWRATLGFGPDEPVTEDSIQRKFRELAHQAHPDKPGGSHEQMAALTEARTLAQASLDRG